jgi:hypothetical protein
MTTQPLPWFRYSRHSAGQHFVTWWVAKRNGRGTVVLHPHCRSFDSEADALAAGADRANAIKVTYRIARGTETELKGAAA